MRTLLPIAALMSLTLALMQTGAIPARANPAPAEDSAPTTEDQAVLEAIAGLGERLEFLEETAAAQAASSQAPLWAVEAFAETDRRLERLARHQERALAALEDPAPRLSEPMVLLSVGLCMLLIGFIAGRFFGNRRPRDRRGIL